MHLTSVFIIYLILFRLAIITTGIVSIVLGYRLFIRGVWPNVSESSRTSVDAEIAGSRFTLKNAAPGTCFALFGVLIISVMFAAGGPELTLTNLKDAANMKISPPDYVASEAVSLKLKGVEADALITATRQGLHYENEMDTLHAIAAYEEAVKIMAEPMNNLAWLYQEKGRFDDALPLSQLAVKLRPEEPNYLDTLAEILYKRGNYIEALRQIKKAALLDARFRHKVDKFRRAMK
ncbi:MAG: tetratricopeptide repeat protein [Candidatus Lokiarchaeota archaeon]|nr:tetratricopeptide repeat protein [Candidatus Lokiarchaeota archaeon]